MSTIIQTGNSVSIQSGNRVIITAPGPQGPPGSGGGSGTGDVVGPSSATDNAIARFNLTTGKLIQNSGITIPDGATGTLSGTNTGDQDLSGYQPLAAVLTGTTASFTTAQESKLAGIEAGAEVNVNADWNAASGDAQILNKPTLGTMASETAANYSTTAAIAASYQPLAAVLTGTTASFTTALETKLGNIEALADVTDAGNVGAAIHGATEKSTPVDADTLPLIDSAASNALKKVTWANIKATLKSYFDAIYVTIGGALGTPSSGTLTNATGLPISSGVSGLGTGIATALAVNTGSAGAPVLFNGAGGTPSALTLTNASGLPLSTGVTGDLPFANLTQATAASKLLGRGSASGAGDFEEITVGTGLTMTGTTLSASGGGGGLTNITETLHTASPNNTVNAVQLEVTGGTTDTDFALTPKGIGAFIVGPEPDSAATGGNKPGESAIQLVLKRSAATQAATGQYATAIGRSPVASGASSFAFAGGNASGQNAIAMGSDFAAFGGTASGSNSVAIFGTASNDDAISIGRGATSSGVRSFSFGTVCIASGQDSTALGRETISSTFGALAAGYYSLADRQMMAWANGRFATEGDAQHETFVSRTKTTNNTPTELFLNGSSTRLTIPSGKVFSGTVNIVGVKSDGTAVARYLRQVTIKNVAGTTSLVGSVITLGTDEAAGTSISITADDTNDALKIEATGITSETWRWVATIEGAEVAYGN